MNKRILLLLLALGSASLLSAQTTLPLYTGTIPNSRPSRVQETSVTLANGGVRISRVVQPTLTVFRAPQDKATGTAVVICPGGGYARLSIDHEGYDVARRLNEMGVTAFVLKYRLPNDSSQTDKTTAPLHDAQQALRLVRQRAADYGVNPARVGIMGFSAGGHLAATAGTHLTPVAANAPAQPGVRPDFLVLIYPVVSLTDSLMHPGSRNNLLGSAPAPAQIRRYSADQQVTAQTPPAFLVHAQDDKTVPVQNSLRFYEACLRRGVPAEMHLYPRGGHGFGLRNQTTKDDWPLHLQHWLEANGWLSR
ncbi:alpha/beta hydrolase [Hymenobacter sp. B81]|uniref:alpha/beta hydrolase n=1 Tax=Hymenobacter sp. B81 TaxID=3344878 RepID=UPI0037DBF111